MYELDALKRHPDDDDNDDGGGSFQCFLTRRWLFGLTTSPPIILAPQFLFSFF